MRLGLFPVDAGTRIVVGPTEPRKFVANVSVHLLLAQNEEAIFVVVRDECQDVVEVISCCLRYGARWLGLAAQKGQHQAAQALLGQMLFDGDCLPLRRRAA
jgi:hypothetical protein